MAELTLSLERELDPFLKEAVGVFKENLSDLAQQASKHALKGYPELQNQPKSTKVRQEINWFENEIEKYLLRVHTSLVTASNSILNKPMRPKSGLDSEAYIAVLGLIKYISSLTG